MSTCVNIKLLGGRVGPLLNWASDYKCMQIVKNVLSSPLMARPGLFEICRFVTGKHARLLRHCANLFSRPHTHMSPRSFLKKHFFVHFFVTMLRILVYFLKISLLLQFLAFSIVLRQYGCLSKAPILLRVFARACICKLESQFVHIFTVVFLIIIIVITITTIIIIVSYPTNKKWIQSAQRGQRAHSSH